MATQATLGRAYSQAPDLHPNLLIASFQLLGWVLFHPQAWRSYLATIDPQLQPDCTLADLRREHWRHPRLRRVLHTYLVYVPLILGVSVLALSATGRAGTMYAAGVAAPLLVSLILLLVGSLGFGIAVGLALSVPGGLIFALGFALIGELGYPSYVSLRTMMLYTGMLGLGGSIAGSVANTMSSRKRQYGQPGWRIWSKWISGLLIGLLIGGLAVFTTYSILHLAIQPLKKQLDTAPPLSLPLVLGLFLLPIVLLVLLVDWRRARGILATTLAMLLITMAAFATLRQLDLADLACVGFTCMFLTLISLPYAMVERIVGPRAGVVVGTLGLGGGFILWMMIAENMPVLETLLASFGCLVLGLTVAWWGELLIHPFLELWNLLLLRMDEGAEPQRPPRLRWHAAFWNSNHRLPFYNLSEHLLLIAERSPAEAQAAIECLSSGRQRWAAQAAQIELSARRLERCSTIAAIVGAQPAMALGELESPISPLLRSFARIAQAISAADSNTTVYHKRLAFVVAEEQLAALLNEMTLSGDSYALRFRPIAERWRAIVAAHMRELTEAIEDSQEIDNPYIFSVPLADHNDLFVGRADVAARIEQLLIDRRRPPLLLYGQRRMGKTSLLRNLGRLLPSSTVLLFVDGEGVAGASTYPDFLYGIALAIVRSAEQHRRLALPRPDYATLAERPFGGFNEWLDTIERTIGESGYTTALLALDEFETLGEIIERGRFDERDVLRMLRNLVQHRPLFKVLLAGSHTLEEFRHWASYLINMQVIKISYLAESDALQLIESPVANFPLRFEPAASQAIIALTRCHPHLVQLLCYEIVELKNRRAAEQRRLVTPQDVEDSVAQALRTGDFFFSDMANQAGPGGLAALQLIAAAGPGGGLADALGDGAGEALELLLRRDVIELDGERYRFQVEMIRRWFAQTTHAALLARTA